MQEEIVSYRLVSIQEREFLSPYLPEELRAHFDKNSLGFTFNFSFRWDLEKESFRIALVIRYTYEGRADILMRFGLEIAFEVKNLNQYFDNKANEFSFPGEFLAILVGITLSTARGMIASRTSGAFINQFYIPILDPSKIAKDLIVSDQTDEAIIY